MLALLKQKLRSCLIACVVCYRRYRRFKYLMARFRALSYFLGDIRQAYAFMYWGGNEELSRDQLQARLLFYYHKIEKALSLPGRKRLFAVEVIPEVTGMLEVWERGHGDRNDPIYKGAINSLIAYSDCVKSLSLDPDGLVLPALTKFLSERHAVCNGPDTPLRPERVVANYPISLEDFRKLMLQRRSYRDFSSECVPPEVLRSAVELAQLSPSACNRQPCRVHVMESETVRSAALLNQNGNAGFGHLAPVVLAITSDASYFFDATERHQPYVDGGLFSMSLIYALQVQGLVSCCLNWCVHPEQDRGLRRVIPIKSSEQIIMLLAVGYPPDEVVVPKSHRRLSSDVVSWH